MGPPAAGGPRAGHLPCVADVHLGSWWTVRMLRKCNLSGAPVELVLWVLEDQPRGKLGR